jgi:hypothetical protein
MSLQGSMTVERMCELVRVSRASFYRSLKEQRRLAALSALRRRSSNQPSRLCPRERQSPPCPGLTYGGLGGIGTGIIYVGTVCHVAQWFPDRRGLATGLVASPSQRDDALQKNDWESIARYGHLTAAQCPSAADTHTCIRRLPESVQARCLRLRPAWCAARRVRRTHREFPGTEPEV